MTADTISILGSSTSLSATFASTSRLPLNSPTLFPQRYALPLALGAYLRGSSAVRALSTDAMQHHKEMTRRLTENREAIKVYVEAAGNGAGV